MLLWSSLINLLCLKNLLRPENQSSGLHVAANLAFYIKASALETPVTVNDVSMFKLTIEEHFERVCLSIEAKMRIARSNKIYIISSQ